MTPVPPGRGRWRLTLHARSFQLPQGYRADPPVEPAAVWGNITAVNPSQGPNSGGYVITVTGGPFPPTGGSGWQWRIGAQVVPYTVVSGAQVQLFVPTPLGNPPGWVQIINERQQPGDVLGTADFLVTQEASGAYPTLTGLAELIEARTRRVETKLNQPAQLTFTMDGRDDGASMIRELQHDVIAWRWDEATGADVPMFRGPVTQSEDELSETAHTVTFTCHDYFSMLSRRILTNPTPLNYGQTDQDDIVVDLVARALRPRTSAGGDPFYPGSELPIAVALLNPDGSTRPRSGQVRDRSYLGGSVIGTLIDDLANVINGFEYGMSYRSDLWGTDHLDLYYPARGETRDEPALVYGDTVAGLTRSVNSGNYANYWRVLGNSGDADPNSAQLWSEAWNTDSNNITVLPVGLWMGQDNAADVSMQSTLDQKAQGDLDQSGILIPSYSLTMRPDAYSLGSPNIGDTLPFVVHSGRLHVDTSLRVVGITYIIGDDGQEDIELAVGRPAVTLAQVIADAHIDINALARR